MSNPIRRITTPNLSQQDVYLTLRVPNTEKGAIDIPMANEMFPVRDKTQQAAPPAGKAKTLLAPCNFAWMNHPGDNTLNVSPGDFTDIARFQTDLRHSIYQQLKSVSKDDLQQKPWTELIDPLLLQQLQLAMQSPDPSGDEKNHVDLLNPGYIYIYKDGFLWREIYVNESGSYSEVNLLRYAGKDDRPHTGVMDWSVILPQRVHGHVPNYQIAYAPVQWSWARINYFGGMDPEDLRIINKKVKPPMPSDLPKSKIPNNPAKNRAQRMQNIELSPFASADAQINKTTSGEGETPNVVLIEKSYHPTILLADPVGLAARLGEDLTYLNLQLQKLMHEATQEKRFQTALLCQQIFFNPKTAFSKTITETLPMSAMDGFDGGRPQTITAKKDNVVKEAAKYLDRDKVEKILRVKERAAIRNLIEIMQQALIELISNTTPTWYNTPIDFNTEFKDICASCDYNYTQAFASIAGILANTGYNPHSLDHGLDIELSSKAPFVPPAEKYIQQLTNTAHPLYDVLFPSQQQVDDAKKKIQHDPDYAKSITKADCVKQDDGSGSFNTMAFALSFEGVKSNTEALFESMVTLQEKFTRSANEEQRTKNAKQLLKLYKVSGQPLLTEVEVVKTGNVPEGYGIIGFDKTTINNFKTSNDFYYHSSAANDITPQDKAEMSQHIQAGTDAPRPLKAKFRAQKINLIAQMVKDTQQNGSAANSAYRPQTAYKNINGQVLRQFTASDVENNTGASFTPESNVNDIYQSITEGDLGKDIKATVFAIPKKHIFNFAKGAGSGLAFILLGMQLYNLTRIRSEAIKYHSLVAEGFKIGEMLGFTLYSIEATYVYFYKAENARNFYHLLSKEIPVKSKDWVNSFQDFTQSIFKVSRLTPLASLGVIACGISAGFSFFDMIHQVKEDNPGEACADLLQMGSDVYTALAILETYAESAAVFESLSAILGPFGLIAAILGIIALVLASIFEETPFEHWAKTCPLSLKDPDKNMTEYASCTSLLSILLTPQVSLRQIGDTNNKAYQSIEVYVALPSFKIGDTSLQVETTYSKETQTQVTLTAGGIPAPPAIQPNDLPQTTITPTEIQECIDDKNRVVGMRYIYQNIPANLKTTSSLFISDTDQMHYRTRVRLYTNKHRYSLPYVAGQNKSPKTEQLTKHGHIDTTQPGWIYAEGTF